MHIATLQKQKKKSEELVEKKKKKFLKNAIEAAPEDSYVTVQMQRDHDVRIFIHNQGLIPLDLQKTFFERYAKGKSSRGSGLGTYSARLIARAHGGDITFTSNPEQGTEIQVSLPVEP